MDESEPAGHDMHCDAPVDAEYVPLAHAMHVPVPERSLYFPVTHIRHGPPSAPVVPALQAHALAAVLPRGASEFVRHPTHANESFAPVDTEYVPFPHTVHASAPVKALYVPATHSKHVPPSAPVAPTSHRHAAIDPDPKFDDDRAGHS